MVFASPAPPGSRPSNSSEASTDTFSSRLVALMAAAATCSAGGGGSGSG